MLKLHFPDTIYRKQGGPSSPHWPTPQSPPGADANKGACLTLQSPAALRPHALSSDSGQAPSLQLWAFCSDSHQRGSVPRLLCLLVTGWLPIATHVHVLPGPHPEGKRQEREKNALCQHGMQIIPVCTMGQLNLVASPKHMQVPGTGHGLLGSHGSGPLSGAQDKVDAYANLRLCLGVRNGCQTGNQRCLLHDLIQCLPYV